MSTKKVENRNVPHAECQVMYLFSDSQEFAAMLRGSSTLTRSPPDAASPNLIEP